MSIADRMSDMGGGGMKKAVPVKKMGAAPMAGAEPGSIAAHLKQMQGTHGGKHMHIADNGGSLTTHHVGEDGKIQGPHDHPDMESVKNHADQVFDEGGNQGSGEPEDRGGDRGLFGE